MAPGVKAWQHQAFAGVSFHTSKAKPKGGANDHGAIAQLVEHLHGMQGVRSSSLLGSILQTPSTARDFREPQGSFFVAWKEA